MKKLALILSLLASCSVWAQGSIEAGKAKSQTCVACHGADGNSQLAMYPKLAGMWGALLFFGTTFADFMVQKSGVSETKKIIVSLMFPNVAIARANRNLAQFEYKPGGHGLSFNETLFESLDNYRISTYFLVMTFALVSQMLIGFLFEKYGSLNEIIYALKITIFGQDESI